MPLRGPGRAGYHLDLVSIVDRLRLGSQKAALFHGCGLLLLTGLHFGSAHHLPPAEYGLFNHATTLATLLVSLVGLGWHLAAQRLVPELVAAERPGAFRGFLKVARVSTAVFASLVSLGLIAGSRWASESDPLRSSLVAAAAILPPLAILRLDRWILRSLERVAESILPEDVLLPAFALGALLAFDLRRAEPLLAAYALGAVAAVFLTWYWLRRWLPETIRTASAEIDAGSWIRIALPLLAGHLALIGLRRVPIVILGAAASPEEIAFYGIADRIALLEILFLGVIATIAGPLIASAWHSGRRNDVDLLTKRVTIWSASAGLAFLAAILLGGERGLAFIRPEYVTARPMLLLLAVGQLGTAAAGAYGMILSACGGEREWARTTIWITTLASASHAIVIPRFGSFGAAVVTAVALILLAAWQFLLGRRWSRRADRITLAAEPIQPIDD